MKKRIILLCVLLLAFSQVKAQTGFPDTSNYHPNCGLTAEKLMTMGVLTNAPNIPVGYPAAGIITCGKFKVYYDDVAYTTGGGFDEPGGIGSTRRNTMCAVLTYIESVYDFGNIPSGQYIRLHVDSSYTHTYHSPDKANIGFGAPFFNRPLPTGTIANGFIYDYIHTGSDPMPGNWHGEVQFNFDSLTVVDYFKSVSSGNLVVAVDFQNGLGAVQACQYDGFSTFLHMVSHALGYYGMKNVVHGGIWSTGVYTSLDTAARTGTMPLSTSTWASDPLTPAYLTGAYAWWMDNSPLPYRIPMFLGHFQTAYMLNRPGSGKIENFVMRDNLIPGLMYRQYTKEELKLGNKILGYAFNPTLFSGSSSSALYYNNRRPWCSKNFDYYLARGMTYNPFHFQDTINADFTITNNIGATLVINLSADTSLHDDDGDLLSVVPATLVNIRGCGVNGNNHNALVLSNGNKTITFTPRPNFYGRAQFIFTVFDGKEEGTRRIYTIDVLKGTNVNVPVGQNLVLNGDNEMGTEVKMLDSFEHVPYSASPFIGSPTENGMETREGTFFNDAQPYSNPPVIRNSRVECFDALHVPTTFGTTYGSFPWAWDTIGYWWDIGCHYTVRYPDAPSGKGNRYAYADFPSLYNLGDSVRKCHSYLLEFDAFRTIIPRSDLGSCFTYPLVDTIYVGFTDGTHLVKTTAFDAYKSYPIPYATSDKINNKTWTHLNIPFNYCSDTAKNVLYIKVGRSRAFEYGYPNGFNVPNYHASFLIDNVSLKEIPLTVKITDTLIEACIHKLTATPNIPSSCGPYYIYTWTTLSGKVLGVGPVVGVSPVGTTKYIVTMEDGCHVVKDTVTVQGVYCPCGPHDVFGDTVAFYPIRGVISSIPPAPYYFVTGPTTLTGDATIKAANVLIIPGVEIQVADSAKLTLDSAHLFTCPTDTKMWSGIKLASGPTKSGRIVVKNNSCIEDAMFAIDAQDLKAPLNGNIIDVTSSTFNRNQVDISVNRAYTPSSAGTFPIQIVNSVFTARLFTRFNSPGYPFRWPSVSTLKGWVTPPIDGKPSYAVNRNYLKSLCKDTSIFSYLGVRINTIGTTFGSGSSFNEVVIGGGSTADDFNMFDNHAYGVVVYNSNVTLYNNTFTHISRRMAPSTSTTLPVENGMAVMASGDPAKYQRLQLVPYGMNFQNRFHDCYAPIYAQSFSELNIKNTVITSSHRLGEPTPGAAYPSELYIGTGITVVGDGSHTAWTITNNEISNMNTGIYAWLAYAKEGATTVIDKNKFRAANNDWRYSTLTRDQYMLQGIEVFSPASGGLIKTLSVSENEMYDVFKGISINGLKDTRTTINLNKINLWDVTRSVGYIQDGIALTHCYDATVKENNIITPVFGAAAEENRLRAFFAANNTNLKVCSNTATRTGRGFEFGQWTTQTGVRWIGNTMNNNWKGFVLGSEIGDQGLMRTIIGKYYYGAIGNIWSGFGAPLQSQTYGDKDRRTWLAKLYVRNITSSFAERPTTNRTSHFSNLFPYLYSTTSPTTEPPSIIIANGTANCDGRDVNVVDKPHPFPMGIQKTLAGLVVSDSMNYEPWQEFSQWMAQLSIYEMGMLEPDLVSGSQVFTQFMNNAAPSRFAWIWNTQKALAEGNLNAAENMLLQTPAAMGRIPVSPDVVITDIHEADYVVGNYQDYFGLYLKFLKGTLDENGKTTLFALAQKCPAVDGAVVYQARGLYRRISGEVINYDDDSCMYGVSNWYKKAPKDQLNGLLTGYTMYPNPNQGSFTIRQTAPAAQQVNVRVYNAIGVQIYQSYSNFTNGTISVQLGSQPQGIYLVCIEDGEKAPTCLRFTIK
jgi:hypothetical protein